MTIVNVAIGNSDDKLGQKGWSGYIIAVDRLVTEYSLNTHFKGFSGPDSQWQNASWTFEFWDALYIDDFKVRLSSIARYFKQESIALLVGETEFVKGVN